MKRAALAVAVCCGLGAVAGCKKKTTDTSGELTGLAAVPASAEVVIGADVPRVSDSPLVERAVDQLLGRDSDLAAKWDKLREVCKIDRKQFKSILLAIGPKQSAQPGSGPVLMVATGQITEPALSACVRAMVGQGGGQLTAKGRVYEAREGNRTMYFAFGRPDTVVLSSNEDFVNEALGTGKKVLDNPDMKKWIDLADTRQPMWAAGKVDDRVRAGLVKVTNGQVSAGPAAIVMDGDLGQGIKLSAKLVMANVPDAKALESFAKANLGMMSMAAQAKSLGKVIDKIVISSKDDMVRVDVNLDLDDVNQLLSALDGGGSAAQDSPPPP